MAPQTIVVIGGLDADLIMIASRIPDRGKATCHKRAEPGGGGSDGSDSDGSDSDGSDSDGIAIKMIGAVGDDRYGAKFMDELSRNGVDTSGIVTVPDLVTMIETAGNAGIDFCLNAAPATPIGRRFYRHLTHLLVNESEAATMSGRDRDEVNEESWPAIAQEFLDRGVKNVVITLGAKGAFYANADGPSGNCPAYEVVVKDSTGAGDTFTGAYSSDFLRQKAKGTWDIKSAVMRVNKAAAMTIRSVGAQDGIPWSDEIDRFDALYKTPANPRAASTVGIAE
ncbi:ribokinase [Podospora appendiculata]|uniref:Ribokinase n=1 Tax=Podospora appendiculata TaxID=314037 RepID=A0AAE0X768_9PEZI|nr:ribokinase [Podospora appendiculata]